MSKKYDVVFVQPPTREGDKPRYLNCGAVFSTEKGFRIKLDSIPVGFNGWFSLYEPKPKGGSPAERSVAQDFDDDLPF